MPLDNPFEPMIKNIGNYVTETLYSQGTIPPINIDNYEGLAVSSPADTHLLAAKDPVINEVAVGMSGNLIGSNVVTGTPPLQLPNSAGYPLQWWQVNLSPYQEGTGDPSPNNVRPIHGTDKVTVWTSGKNLYSREDSEYNVPVYASDGTSAPYPDVAVWWMPVKPNTNYTVSCNHNETTFYLRWINCDSNKGFINRVGYAYTENDLPLTITTPANCGWVQIAINQHAASQIALNDWEVMVVEGSASADYEPYNGSQTVITLPQTVYTGTVGSDGGVSRTVKRTFTGSAEEQWMYSSGWSKENTAVFYAQSQLIDAINADNNATYITNCNLFVPQSRNTLYALDTPCIGYSGALNVECYLTVRVAKVIASNLSEFETYLASNPIEIVYKLATSVQFPITSPTIPAPHGTAYAWATAEDGTVDSMGAAYIQNE